MDTTSAPPMPGLPTLPAPPILSPNQGSVLQGATVAKKRTVKPTVKRAAGATSQPVATQPNAITIRGSAEWKGWLEAFAAKMRSKPTAIMDLALAKLAAQEGFTEPPPRI